MDPFNDWSDCGLATVRAVLAEAITAEFAHSQDPNATWHGGQQRGYDLTSKDGKRDAKCVRIDKDGYIVLARRNAEPVDPERVDRLMLLRLSASTRYRVDLASGTAELTASTSILDAWDVPVAALNQVLPEQTAAFCPSRPQRSETDNDRRHRTRPEQTAALPNRQRQKASHQVRAGLAPREGAPRRIRTFDLPLRRRSLYPLSYRGRCPPKPSRSAAGPGIVWPGIVGWGATGTAEECGTVQVRDVMTEATITETPADKLRTAAERMWREQTGSLLITTDGRLTGIITERDVLRAVALGADPDLATVDEAMTIGVYTVPPDMPLHVAAREMAARWIRHLPVVENGRLLGVISMRDVTGVFGALGTGDSEIDIEHEFDQLVRKRRLARIEGGDQA